MELSELQQRVDTWIKEYGVRYFSELTNMAVLTEEVGELARVMARKYGDQSFKAGEKENLADEMADVLWVLVCLANQTGVDLTRAVEANFAKKSARLHTRFAGNGPNGAAGGCGCATCRRCTRPRMRPFRSGFLSLRISEALRRRTPPADAA